MNNTFTDIHHHLLYGVDDGPRDEAGMIRMLRRAAQEGIRRIIATPHVSPGVEPCPVEEYQRLIGEANRLSRELDLDLQVDLGAELLYTPQLVRFVAEERVPTLAGSDRVLVEFSPDVKYETIVTTVEQLLGVGYFPVLAHMERYTCLSSSFRRTQALHDHYDVCFQVNTRSIVEGGFFQRRYVKRMLENKLIDAIATDAHNTRTRPAQMLQAYQLIAQEHGEEYARLLVSGDLLNH